MRVCLFVCLFFARYLKNDAPKINRLDKNIVYHEPTFISEVKGQDHESQNIISVGDGALVSLSLIHI